MRDGVLAPGWSALFCLTLFYFALFLLARIPVPPSGRLRGPLYREAGGARASPSLYFCVVFCFFTSHSVYLEGSGKGFTIYSDLLFLVIYRPADPLGSILFWYTFSRYVSL